MAIEFTLVSTVYNEINRLDDTINDLEHQTLQPTEIVITDAGSTDGTYQKLLDWKQRSDVPVTILQKAKCNVAEGRNMAIRAAKYKIISSTDFGCRFHRKWLESLITPFQDQQVKAVAGTASVIEEDITTITAKAAYILYDGYKQVVTENFIPSSRSIAYYKEVYENIGGYYEWLTLAADDTIFGLIALQKGYKFYVVKKPYVYWGRHTNAKAYAKESFRYGLGGGEARMNFWSTVLTCMVSVLRYFFYILLLPLILLIVSKQLSSLYLLILLPLAVGFKDYVNYTKTWLNLRSNKYNFKVYSYGLYLFELTRFHYLKGYFKGYFKSPPFRKEEAKKLQLLFASVKKE